MKTPGRAGRCGRSAIGVLAVLVTATAHAGLLEKTRQAPNPRSEFVRLNPCPANGKSVAVCPGYVMELAIPSCAGGLESADNFVWRRASDARRREAVEQRLCGCVRNPPGNTLVCPGRDVASASAR